MMGKVEDTKLGPGLDFDPLEDKTSASDGKLEKFKALYIAANELMMKIGIDGQISIRDPRCNRLMDALAGLDGGEYDVDKVF